MGIATFIADVEADLIAGAGVGTAGIKFMRDTGKAGDIGAGRITWNPGRGPIAAARAGGAAQGRDGDIATRRPSVTFEVWGEDIEDAERLIEILLNSLHRVGSSFTAVATDEDWQTGGVNARGANATITASLAFGVPRDRKARAPISSITTKINIGHDDQAVSVPVTEDEE